MIHPKLREVRAQPGSFNPGDRVIVKTSSTLNWDELRKLANAVKKFCGCDVRVLVVNCLDVQIWRLTDAGPHQIVSPEVDHRSMLGVVNLSCSKVRFYPGERLLVKSKSTDFQKKKLKEHIVEWAGSEVEVLCE